MIDKVEVVALTDVVRDVDFSTCGVRADYATQFLRAKIRQRLFYSRRYNRLKTRNSYTVCYSQDGGESMGL